MGPQIIRQLERRASRRSASFFHALASPGRPRNGGGAAGAYSPAEGRKTLIQGHFRAQKGPLGPSRKSQQQTKRTGFAALEDSIADEAPEGKRAKRANRALNRAEINDRAQKHGGAGTDRRGRSVISGRWRRRGRSQRARAQPSPPRSRRPAPPRPTRRSGRPSSTSTRSSSATGRRRRSTPWGWRWRRIARTTIAGSTSTSSTGPRSWTPPSIAWTRTALRRSTCGRHSGNGSESWRRCSTGTSPSSSIGRRRGHERVRPP